MPTIDGNVIIKYEFTVFESNHILNALQELPAKISNPITDKMRQQADPQIKAATVTEEKDDNAQ